MTLSGGKSRPWVCYHGRPVRTRLSVAELAAGLVNLKQAVLARAFELDEVDRILLRRSGKLVGITDKAFILGRQYGARFRQRLFKTPDRFVAPGNRYGGDVEPGSKRVCQSTAAGACARVTSLFAAALSVPMASRSPPARRWRSQPPGARSRGRRVPTASGSPSMALSRLSFNKSLNQPLMSFWTSPSDPFLRL